MFVKDFFVAKKVRFCSSFHMAGGLVSQKFLIISSNIFLKIDSADSVILPAEVCPSFIIPSSPWPDQQVGIVRFSLEGGLDLDDVFHAFPQPGDLPV